MGYQATRYFNSVKVHPQMGHNGHPVDGALVGAGSLSTWALGMGPSVGTRWVLWYSSFAPVGCPQFPQPLVIS